jgi:short subunit dehydrogenase-like uncharacterized protein
MPGWLIYGANGYTAGLIAREAIRRHLQPTLAGRNADAVKARAAELALEHRIFALNDPIALTRGIESHAVVLNCAGPFSHTATPMADACLRCRIHYVDITGEEQVLQALAQRDAEARSAGVMLLPGAGFDVVPSDCLAAHLKRRLPSANWLALAFQSSGRLSRGTALTVIEGLAGGGLIRRGGRLTAVPAAYRTRSIDFGSGPVKAITIPWGDVVTAYYSTGIPDIEVYMAAPCGTRLAMRLSRFCSGLLGSRAVQGWLRRRVLAGPPGPSAEERQRGSSMLWGEAADDSGRRVVTRLRGPEAYEFTVRAALAVIGRVFGGAAPPGFQTPAMAYGPDFVLDIEGVVRQDGPQSEG